MPWQSVLILFVLNKLEISYCYNILPPDIVVVDARIHIVVVVVQLMTARIKSSITEVKATRKGLMLINNNQLLMVRPKEWQHCSRMPQHFYVRMQGFQRLFGPQAVIFKEFTLPIN